MLQVLDAIRSDGASKAGACRLPYYEAQNPIARMGAIGDGRTVALVRDDTSMPYLCWPWLDSSPVMDAVLSGETWCHAAFGIDGVLVEGKQAYRPGTNVLETVIETDAMRIRVTDAMAWSEDADGPQRILRRAVCERGAGRLTFHAGWRETDAPFGCTASFLLADGAGEVAMAPGDVAWVVLHDPREALPEGYDPADEIEAAADHWRDRLRSVTYDGPRRALVERAALAMWLCERRTTRGLAAAATFAFPEAPAGARNWDYRYAWVRDTAFAVGAAVRIGLHDDALAWLRFVVMENEACEPAPLRLMQTLDGQTVPGERQLDGYSGVMAAQPVQVGNEAGKQLQLDMFGEIVMGLKALTEAGVAVPADMLARLRELLDWLKVHWREPDSSIWELRGGRKRYLFSTLMSWVAFRDATSLFEAAGEVPDPSWPAYADKVAVSLRTDYWCPTCESYMQTAECTVVDAAVVMMRVTGFLAGDDPRWHTTKDMVRRDLLRPQPDPSGLLRYPHHAKDGFEKDEGTFMLCTGWWVQALWMDGEHDEARAAFDAMVARLGPTGLASEEIGDDGNLWGNIPQMFSHAAIVDAFLMLES